MSCRARPATWRGARSACRRSASPTSSGPTPWWGLAGDPLFDGTGTAGPTSRRRAEPGADALGQLVSALGRLSRRPGTLIAASSVGYYGYQGISDAPVDETHPAGSDWWGRDSAAIEQAGLATQAHGVRTVLLRTGYALTPDSLAAQVAQFRRHFGGWIGTGRGWTPWIRIADVVGIIAFALQQRSLDGPVNLTAPEPVRAREFAPRRRASRRPPGLAAGPYPVRPDGPGRDRRHPGPGQARRPGPGERAGLPVPLPRRGRGAA